MIKMKKPCPFCGGEAKAVKVDIDTNFPHWIVGCCSQYGSACPCYIWKGTPKYFSLEEAEKFWNSRKRKTEKGKWPEPT